MKLSRQFLASIQWPQSSLVARQRERFFASSEHRLQCLPSLPAPAPWKPCCSGSNNHSNSFEHSNCGLSCIPHAFSAFADKGHCPSSSTTLANNQDQSMPCCAMTNTSLKTAHINVSAHHSIKCREFLFTEAATAQATEKSVRSLRSFISSAPYKQSAHSIPRKRMLQVSPDHFCCSLVELSVVPITRVQ